MATARNTLAVAIKLDGTAQAKKDLEDVGKAGEQAFAKIAAAANKIAPGLGNKLQGALRAIRTQFLSLQAAGARFAQSLATLNIAVNTVGRSLTNMAKRIGVITTAIGGAVAAVGVFFKRAGDNAERITGQAEALGISAQAYQTFQAAVTNAGLSQEQFDQILGRFVTTAAEGSASAEDMAKSFREVEVTLADGSKKMVAVRGTSDALSKSLTETSQAFRQVEITAEDGSKKLISVRGTSEQLAKSLGNLGKGGEQGLIAFAKKIEGLKTAQQRLNAVIEFGFAKRAAPAAVRALLAIARDADPAARALNRVLEPLSDIELGALLQVDTAFDRLFLNIFRLKDQIAAIFGPAVADLLNGLADAIFENQKAIKEWADTIAKEAVVVVKDLFALLRGDDAAVQNKGLIQFRDLLIGIGQTISQVFFGVVVPAFEQVTAAAEQVAGVINSIFGTEFTGTGLIVVAVIAQITGAFTLLLSLLSLGAASIQLLTSGFGLLVAVLRPLAVALGFVGAALASLLGLPVAVGVAIVAAIAVAAAATFVYWDEIKAGAQQAWAFAALQVEAFANKTAEIFSQGTLDAAWQAIKDGSQSAWDFAYLQAQAFVTKTSEILSGAGNFFGNWRASFESFFSGVLSLASSFASSLVSTISRAVSSIISAVERAISAFRRLFAAQSKSSSKGTTSGSNGGSGFARGGRLHGPGTATSDSIPIWGSAGEFMVRTRAAMKVGYGFLNAVNSGRYDLAGIFDLLRARGYALGGAIGGLSPALAGGLSVDLPRLSFGPIDERSSPIAALQPVTFVLDGQRVDGFSAAPGAVGELMRASSQKRIRSNGRKPGWYGGSV